MQCTQRFLRAFKKKHVGGYKWKSEYGEPGKPLGSGLDRV